MGSKVRIQYPLFILLSLSLTHPIHADNRSGSLDDISLNKNQTPLDESKQGQEIELNPANDYVRNAARLTLPAMQQIEFTDSAKQAAFLILNFRPY